MILNTEADTARTHSSNFRNYIYLFARRVIKVTPSVF